MINNSYLAFDFDGVIVDSLNECMVVGYNAFSNYQGNNKRIFSPQDIPPTILDNAIYLRNYIRSGYDYVYIFFILENEIQIKDQHQFDSFTEKHRHLQDEFEKIFYKQRHFLFLEHHELWVKLNPFYQGVADLIKPVFAAHQGCIISTKKSSYIASLLQANNISLDSNLIYHAGKGRSKRNIIIQLLQKQSISPANFYFIEDQIDTLIKLQDLKINSMLAEWGYNTNAQQQIAHENDIPVISLNKISSQFPLTAKWPA